MIRVGLGVAAALLFLLAFYMLFRRKTPLELLEALQREVKPKGGVVFQTGLAAKPAALLVMDCKVFVLDANDGKVKRTKVLSTGFYLGWTTCTGQSIRAENGFVLVELSNQAIGAGGGNISGGSYRSKNGLKWEKKTAKGWLPVDEAQT